MDILNPTALGVLMCSPVSTFIVISPVEMSKYSIFHLWGIVSPNFEME